MVACNEDGFSDSNVTSICSTGDSSKGGQAVEGRKRYVGEKGIGFKTVFGISPAPHIISRHFAFHYKPKSEGNPFNLVMPYWIKDEGIVTWARNFARNHLGLAVDSTRGTVMLLPIIAEKMNLVASTIQDFAKDRDGLLFLTKIGRVAVKQFATSQDPSVSSSVAIEAEPLLVTLATCPTVSAAEFTEDRCVSLLKVVVEGVTPTICTWLRVDMTFKATEEDESRKNVTGVPISIAMPLDPSKQLENISSGRLYAFLPTNVRDSRLPCLVHADFVMGTSRESFDASNKWNTCILRTFFPQIYVAAFEYLIAYLYHPSTQLPLNVKLQLLVGAFPSKADCASEKLRQACEQISGTLATLKFVPCAHVLGIMSLAEVTIAPRQVLSVITSHDDMKKIHGSFNVAALKPLAHSLLHEIVTATKLQQQSTSFFVPSASEWTESHWKQALHATDWLSQQAHDAPWFCLVFRFGHFLSSFPQLKQCFPLFAPCRHHHFAFCLSFI